MNQSGMTLYIHNLNNVPVLSLYQTLLTTIHHYSDEIPNRWKNKSRVLLLLNTINHYEPLF